MRKLLILTLMLASFGVFGFGTTEAKANAVANAPQIVIQERGRHRGWYRNNNRRHFRTVRTTRIVRYGYRTYRETYLVRYFDNGRTSTTLINRERIS